MLERLEKFTGPKILKSLEAKIKAIVADKKNQEASFELEKQRLARLQKCIDNCTLRAPGDGILVYANQANRLGTGRSADRAGCDRPRGPVDLPASRSPAHAREDAGQRDQGRPDQDRPGGDHPGRRLPRAALAWDRGRGHRHLDPRERPLLRRPDLLRHGQHRGRRVRRPPPRPDGRGPVQVQRQESA